MATLNAAVRTTKGLCNVLFDELDLLRNGKSNPHRAAAVAKLAVQIINTKRLEIEAACLSREGVKLMSLSLRHGGLALGA